jgi:hypothetical protein
MLMHEIDLDLHTRYIVIGFCVHYTLASANCYEIIILDHPKIVITHFSKEDTN